MTLLAGTFMHLPQARKKAFARDFAAFTDGDIHPDRLPELMQDIIDCYALPLLPAKFTIAAQHCFDRGLVYLPGQYPHDALFKRGKE